MTKLTADKRIPAPLDWRILPRPSSRIVAVRPYWAEPWLIMQCRESWGDADYERMTGISLPTRSIRRVSISRLIVSPVPRSAANAMLINLAPVPFRNASREPL
jgi:hypothetical protein